MSLVLNPCILLPSFSSHFMNSNKSAFKRLVIGAVRCGDRLLGVDCIGEILDSRELLIVWLVR